MARGMGLKPWIKITVGRFRSGASRGAKPSVRLIRTPWARSPPKAINVEWPVPLTEARATHRPTIALISRPVAGLGPALEASRAGQPQFCFRLRPGGTLTEFVENPKLRLIAHFLERLYRFLIADLIVDDRGGEASSSSRSVRADPAAPHDG